MKIVSLLTTLSGKTKNTAFWQLETLKIKTLKTFESDQHFVPSLDTKGENLNSFARFVEPSFVTLAP